MASQARRSRGKNAQPKDDTKFAAYYAEKLPAALAEAALFAQAHPDADSDAVAFPFQTLHMGLTFTLAVAPPATAFNARVTEDGKQRLWVATKAFKAQTMAMQTAIAASLPADAFGPENGAHFCMAWDKAPATDVPEYEFGMDLLVYIDVNKFMLMSEISGNLLTRFRAYAQPILIAAAANYGYTLAEVTECNGVGGEDGLIPGLLEMGDADNEVLEALDHGPTEPVAEHHYNLVYQAWEDALPDEPEAEAEPEVQGGPVFAVETSGEDSETTFPMNLD